ncbi:hypothetical protein OG985_45615 [Streptomyces sp. NBC_00289]|uniref:hypothetical protein n=1 Tax=Streptomyces sp. NBC_00289 TaxID=2975703 RepID=UPI00324E1C35
MPLLRKALALAGTGAAAAALIALPASPASATTNGGWVNTVAVRVNFHAQDDDSTVFTPDDYTHAYSLRSGKIALTPQSPGWTGINLVSSCAGGEVTGDLGAGAKQVASGYVDYVSSLYIFEDNHCYGPTDPDFGWDGHTQGSTIRLAPGQTKSYKIKVWDTWDNSPGDLVEATVTVTNTADQL